MGAARRTVLAAVALARHLGGCSSTKQATTTCLQQCISHRVHRTYSSNGAHASCATPVPSAAWREPETPLLHSIRNRMLVRDWTQTVA